MKYFYIFNIKFDEKLSQWGAAAGSDIAQSRAGDALTVAVLLWSLDHRHGYKVPPWSHPQS